MAVSGHCGPVGGIPISGCVDIHCLLLATTNDPEMRFVCVGSGVDGVAARRDLSADEGDAPDKIIMQSPF